MINWKYKGKVYYFDHIKAIGITLFLVAAPLFACWLQDIEIIFFNDLVDSIAQVGFFGILCYLIYLNCVGSYAPYYFDENGKKIEGEEPEHLKLLRKKGK